SCRPLQINVVACQLGVGYETLVQHLRWSLKKLQPAQADELLRTSPKDIRRSISGLAANSPHLVVVDLAWRKVRIDLREDDTALLPRGTQIEGSSIALIDDCEDGVLVEARRPGIGRAECVTRSWSSFVR